MDRLKAHEKATVRDWVEAHRDRIEVFFMPARIPEYNPGEDLNNDLKGNVHESGVPGNKGRSCGPECSASCGGCSLRRSMS